MNTGIWRFSRPKRPKSSLTISGRPSITFDSPQRRDERRLGALGQFRVIVGDRNGLALAYLHDGRAVFGLPPFHLTVIVFAPGALASAFT
jgi:hypothetical protein